MKKRIIAVVLLIVMAFSLCGCASMEAYIQKMRGELFGNNYKITEYDNYGNKVFTVYGDKVVMSGQLDEHGEVSSYIDITIDGEEWDHVGSTLVFAQNGVDMITDFEMPETMESDKSSSGWMATDRFVNHYANLFGKKLVVVVSSQNGTPIGIFQGDDCYTEIPGNLPKTTLINIDGKLVYVHRANIDIMPASMFKVEE